MAAAIKTKPSAIRFVTVISSRILPKACGHYGAYTMSSRREPNWIAMAVPREAAGHYRMAKLQPERPYRDRCRCPPGRWRRCRPESLSTRVGLYTARLRIPIPRVKRSRSIRATPFFFTGEIGERAPHPPMDTAVLDAKPLNGGLPRHVAKPGIDPDNLVEYHNRFDFSKFVNKLDAVALPEDGTHVERVAMQTHAVRNNPSYTPEGQSGNFVLNGQRAIAGAPYAEPCITEDGQPVPSSADPLHYRAVDMQMDVVLNKQGWHYSQQRFAVLWEDLMPTLNKQRPREPLFLPRQFQ